MVSKHKNSFNFTQNPRISNQDNNERLLLTSKFTKVFKNNIGDWLGNRHANGHGGHGPFSPKSILNSHLLLPSNFIIKTYEKK